MWVVTVRWNWCIIHWCFHNFNLKVLIGVLNGNAYQNLKKRTIWMMTNSRYIAYTEPFFKRFHLLNVKDIFDVHCLKFYYEFANNTPSNYLRDMFKHNYELYYIEARNMIGSTNIQLTPIVFVMFYNILYRNYWANSPNIRWAELWRIVHTHIYVCMYIYIYIYLYSPKVNVIWLIYALLNASISIAIFTA